MFDIIFCILVNFVFECTYQRLYHCWVCIVICGLMKMLVFGVFLFCFFCFLFVSVSIDKLVHYTIFTHLVYNIFRKPLNTHFTISRQGRTSRFIAHVLNNNRSKGSYLLTFPARSPRNMHEYYSGNYFTNKINVAYVFTICICK